ncbi:CAP domain-containing protein [Streptomyces sp. NPDC058412]|uniref:CAP domain-containing protein n=1 Tax=Streptomyces sp. NPDC058412 TaxID=3346486 RepID=UPI003651F35E
MQDHGGAYTYDVDGDGTGDDRPGRVGRGHRKARRGAPVLAAAAVAVLLAAGGGAYTLMSGEAPDRIAATGSPSSLAGGPDPVVGGGLPTSTSSPSASASPAAATTATASPSATVSASASAAPTVARSSKPAAPPARSTPGDGPTGPDPKVPGARTSTQDVRTAQSLSLQLLNNERAAVGRPPLALRQDLSDFARKWAERMRTSGFSHSSSEERAYLKTGTRTWTGENIVWYSDASMTAQEAAEKFQSMWRHSPGHYKAQVNPDFTEVGVGLYHDSSGWWGVHNFSDGK